MQVAIYSEFKAIGSESPDKTFLLLKAVAHYLLPQMIERYD